MFCYLTDGCGEWERCTQFALFVCVIYLFHWVVFASSDIGKMGAVGGKKKLIQFVLFTCVICLLQCDNSLRNVRVLMLGRWAWWVGKQTTLFVLFFIVICSSKPKCVIFIELIM